MRVCEYGCWPQARLLSVCARVWGLATCKMGVGKCESLEGRGREQGRERALVRERRREKERLRAIECARASVQIHRIPALTL